MENKIKITSYNDGMVRSWDDGLPIGNGRLGAMISGLPCTESITLNEDSIWFGAPVNRHNPDSLKYFKEIRKLFREGKVKEADKLCYMAMSSLPKYFGAYEPMCELFTFYNHSSNISNYKRELDFSKGIATVDYTVDDMNIHREYFVSEPHQVMVFKISADKPMLDMHINIMRRPFEIEGTNIVDESILHMNGQCGKDGVSFDCLVSAKTDGEMTRIGDFLGFKNASEIIIFITANTSFYEENPMDKAKKTLEEAMQIEYDELKRCHQSNFESLYNRCSIDFGTSSEVSTDERLRNVRAGGKDNGLLELLFNYGRYLMISASRKGTQAMNLQGIWNCNFAADWECNYTININTEMNYWIAEISQLSDCHEPLFYLIERMVPNGEKTAKEVYGCNGFVAHHATNIWGDTAIEGISFPSSIWPVGGAWLIKHLWEHYLHTLDKEFLEKRAFPIMKKSAQFFMEYMSEAEDGYFESGPSLSPENLYVTEDGTNGMHCMAPEMDNQIIRSLFRTVIHACEELGICDEDYEKYKDFILKIRPTRINKNGGIVEWDKDYTELDPGHRHISPMFALHPDYEISPDKTPELALACEKTIERRSKFAFKPDLPADMSGFRGWNGAWLSCCYSKLRKAENALDAIYYIMREKTALTNSLLNRFPVYQIDGNFGLAAAVTEMLLFSDEDRIILLPALPKDLKDGSFNGLVARGGFIIDVKWENGKIISASLKSRGNRICRIKAEGISGVDADFKIEDGYIVFEAEKNKSYNFSI